ncbi:tRNA pseudouridine synthase A [bacterium AB1]|nr:tRNA pseudouridine synthase A [bacterium AB1]
MYLYILFSYCGVKYNGSAIQKNNNNTIQGILTKIFNKINKSNYNINLLSRTDKHVSAYEQIAFFESKKNFDYKHTVKKLNLTLKAHKENIYVIKMGFLSNEKPYRNVKKTYIFKFSLIRNAVIEKTHEYLLCDNAFAKINNIIQILNNKRFDYFMFCKQAEYNKRPTNQILNIEAFQLKQDNIDTINIEFTGSCFLYKQIRFICGTIKKILEKNITINQSNIVEMFCKYKYVGKGQALYLKKFHLTLN